jgi:hypothetical protein
MMENSVTVSQNTLEVLHGVATVAGLILSEKMTPEQGRVALARMNLGYQDLIAALDESLKALGCEKLSPEKASEIMDILTEPLHA